MKYATIICAVLAFASCQKEQPATTCERIEGVWKQTFPPHSIYSFCEGYCTRRVISAGVEVWRTEYTYNCEGDTMRLVDLKTNAAQTWSVEFTNENSATIRTGEAFVVNMVRYP